MTLEEMKRVKRERGFSLAQLSERSGIPLGTIQKIFSGQTKTPRYATRQALEKVLLQDGGIESEHSYPTGAGGSCSYHMDMVMRDSYQLDAETSGVMTVRDGEIRYGGKNGEDRISPRVDMVRESAVKYDVSPVKKQGEYTVEDYYALPDERRVELIDGVIYDMSAPGSLHQRIVSLLTIHIGSYIMKNGGECMVFPSPLDVRLDCDDKTMVQPDVVIVCKREKIKGWGIWGAPDFVLEIISKSTRKKDYTKKLQKYFDAGVREYWIIDPERNVMVSYLLEEDYMPHISPLEGFAGVSIYDGDLQIDLGEIASAIKDWPV